MRGLRRFCLKALCLVPILALAASPSLLPADALQAPVKAEIEQQVKSSLAKMSTGQDQDLVVQGMTAKSRNARIPLAIGRKVSLSAYAPFQVGSNTYDMALRCLTQAVYYEAANEPVRGKRAVAQVVLNRMRHTAYPNSVCGVVYQGVNARVCQFSFTCDGALLRQPLRRQWEESRRVAREALAGKQLSDVGTATHYHADYVVPKWAFTLNKVEVIGTHIFYRFPGRGGSRDAFSAPWSRSERIPQINWARFTPSGDTDEELMAVSEDDFVPGLTVSADPTDRHAVNDVGGRLDTTKQWRLSIPDPVSEGSSYNAAITDQSQATRANGADVLSTGPKEPAQ